MLEANVDLHTQLADKYTECEPHFRPENVRKVRRRLSKICEETKAVKLLEALTSAHPDVADYRLDLANVLDNLGTLHFRQDRAEAARGALERAVAEGRWLTKTFPKRAVFQWKLGSLCNHLTHALRGTDRLQEAESVIREGVSLFSKLCAKNADDLRSSPELLDP